MVIPDSLVLWCPTTSRVFETCSRDRHFGDLSLYSLFRSSVLVSRHRHSKKFSSEDRQVQQTPGKTTLLCFPTLFASSKEPEVLTDFGGLSERAVTLSIRWSHGGPPISFHYTTPIPTLSLSPLIKTKVNCETQMI